MGVMKQFLKLVYFCLFLQMASVFLYAQQAAFKPLYAPWRDHYVNGSGETIVESCPFCDQYAAEQDEKNFLLKRYQHCFVLLNLYPYTTGHLLVIPKRHVPSLTDLTHEEFVELMDIVVFCQRILKNEVRADGFNIGINQGRVAGAGVPAHLHVHVVPRFSGDTSFLTATTATQVVSSDLASVYNKLKPHFDSKHL